MIKKRPVNLRKSFLSLIVILVTTGCGIAVYQRYAEFLTKGQFVISFLLICAVMAFGIFFTGILIWNPVLLGPFFRLKAKSAILRRLAAGILCFLPVYLYIFHRWSEPFGGQWIRIFLCSLSILVAAWILDSENRVSFGSLVSASLCFSVFFALCSQFRDVKSYPFSVGWSEGNRMWDYSVLFGKELFTWPQDQTIPAYIDIGRQSLWGAIFLFPNVTIEMMRAWNDFLFTIPYAILGWVLLSGTGNIQKRYRFAAGLWAMLFLLQGPIYTPLILAAILVVFGGKLSNLPAFILTFIAGIYAVMSRSTWVVAPAAFAVMLAFIEIPHSAVYRDKDRWSRSILLGIAGLLGALSYLKRDLFSNLFEEIAAFGSGIVQAAQDTIESVSAPVVVNGSPALLSPEWFQYFLTRQPLLWNRLWPNDTYKPGIILGLLTAVLPLILLIILWSIQKKWKLDGWQRILLIFGQTAFLGVGILISVKIGGGSNLHNLDIFLIGLLIIGALAWKAGMGSWLLEKIHGENWVSLIVIAAVLIPIANDALTIEPKKYPSNETTIDAVEKIQQAVEENSEGEILFFDQRQMLTFGMVSKIPLIADYEKKWMMDEAMANNAEFFEPYIADLKRHRFDIIISEPLWIKFQGEGLDFSEENDLFVKWISIPTLCYYEPKETFLDQGVQILIPRSEVLKQDGVDCP
ncbi:MAG: hypothetical protein AB9907_11870 [Flexilinea sp.]